jgi:hypothetical protein
MVLFCTGFVTGGIINLTIAIWNDKFLPYFFSHQHVFESVQTASWLLQDFVPFFITFYQNYQTFKHQRAINLADSGRRRRDIFRASGELEARESE